MRFGTCLTLLLFPSLLLAASDRDSLKFKGQLSAYSHFNSGKEPPWWNGGRYIPQLNYTQRLSAENTFDVEASLNIYDNAALRTSDMTMFSNGAIKPYRVWARYSKSQFEIRSVRVENVAYAKRRIWIDTEKYVQIPVRPPFVSFALTLCTLWFKDYLYGEKHEVSRN